VLIFLSEPETVDIYVDGSKIGTTPFEIKNTELAKHAESGYVLIKAKKIGALDESFLIPIESYGQFKLKLSPVSDEHFKKWVLPSYPKELNSIASMLLLIQAKMFLKEFDQAKSDIELFKEKFPQIAAGHTMLATLALHQDKKEEARGHLIRALELDRNDTTAARLLNSIDGKKD
jgi:tetratricopeptide (TPR) repeat protein